MSEPDRRCANCRRASYEKYCEYCLEDMDYQEDDYVVEDYDYVVEDY